MDKEEINRIAKLANLDLTDEEVKEFTPQLSEILYYISQLNEVDTSGTQPTSHVGKNITNIFQKGGVNEQQISTLEALKNAPETKDNHILTEAIL